MALSPEHKQLLETIEASGNGKSLVTAARWLLELSPEVQDRAVTTSLQPNWVMDKMMRDRWIMRKEYSRLAVDLSQDRLSVSLGRLSSNGAPHPAVTTAVLEPRELSLGQGSFIHKYLVSTDRNGRPTEKSILPFNSEAFDTFVQKVEEIVDTSGQEDEDEPATIESFSAISAKAA